MQTTNAVCRCGSPVVTTDMLGNACCWQCADVQPYTTGWFDPDEGDWHWYQAPTDEVLEVAKAEWAKWAKARPGHGGRCPNCGKRRPLTSGICASCASEIPGW